jgi:hypothetical protein
MGSCIADFSSPVFRPMPDVQNFDSFLGVTVHNDVGRDDKFAGSLHLSGSTNPWEGSQLLDAVDYCLCDIPGSCGIVLLNMSNSSFKLI